jgi:hypothetical protein
MRVTIYPSKDELRGAMEAYLIENHQEFYTEARWTSYYNTNFKLRVSFFFFGNLFLNY